MAEMGLSFTKADPVALEDDLKCVLLKLSQESTGRKLLMQKSLFILLFIHTESSVSIYINIFRDSTVFVKQKSGVIGY
jgi:hypothetical protein